jgi:hypothetical protein
MQLTPEQHQFVAAAQGKPVEVIDPQTQQTYVLLPAEMYQRVRGFVEARVEQGQRCEKQGEAPVAQPMRVRLRELAMPPEVAAEVKKHCRKLGLWRQKYVAEVEDSLKIQYYFGGKYIAYLRSDAGPLIVAAGLLDEAFDAQLAHLRPQERQEVVLQAIDRWDGGINLILSPLATHEG